MVSGDEETDRRIEPGSKRADDVVATDVGVENLDRLTSNEPGEPPDGGQVDRVAEWKFVKGDWPPGESLTQRAPRTSDKMELVAAFNQRAGQVDNVPLATPDCLR
jgi:hypothetical protein